MELAAREVVGSLFLQVFKDSLDIALGATAWLTRHCWFIALVGFDNLRDLTMIYHPNWPCDSVVRTCDRGPWIRDP